MTNLSGERPSSRVLIISGKPETCRFLTRLLEKMQVVIEVEASGRTALEHILNKDYFMVIVDCAIRDLDCLDILKSIKLMSYHTRVVMLLEDYRRELLEQVRAAGADHCLFQPLSNVALASELHYLRQGRQSGAYAGSMIGNQGGEEYRE